uniref:hypothetical protein n=1 Tax=Escherichia coli TaxID=562 RepID=UPI001CDB0A09
HFYRYSATNQVWFHFSRKPDLRGRKDANDMIIKNTHKIISDMIFIIDDKTISDIIRNQEHTNHSGYDYYLSEYY